MCEWRWRRLSEMPSDSRMTQRYKTPSSPPSRQCPAKTPSNSFSRNKWRPSTLLEPQASAFNHAWLIWNQPLFRKRKVTASRTAPPRAWKHTCGSSISVLLRESLSETCLFLHEWKSRQLSYRLWWVQAQIIYLNSLPLILLYRRLYCFCYFRNFDKI